jgi:hypothetical protein
MQGRAYNFPIITQIARDYNTIPVTSTPAKHVFSITRNLISKKQIYIASENIRYILCLRSWGYLIEDNNEKEFILDNNKRIIDLENAPVQVLVVKYQ